MSNNYYLLALMILACFTLGLPFIISRFSPCRPAKIVPSILSYVMWHVESFGCFLLPMATQTQHITALATGSAAAPPAESTARTTKFQDIRSILLRKDALEKWKIQLSRIENMKLWFASTSHVTWKDNRRRGFVHLPSTHQIAAVAHRVVMTLHRLSI